MAKLAKDATDGRLRGLRADFETCEVVSLAGAYADVLDDTLTRAASEEREALARVVAEDAREASWMAAAHNIPSLALPTPSLDE